MRRPREGALGAVAIGALIAAVLVVATRSRPPEPTTQPTTGTEANAPAAQPSPLPTFGPEVLESPGAASRLTADQLLATAADVMQGSPLAGDWPVASERPVYVVSANVRNERRLVIADQVVAFRLDQATDVVTLRFLAAASGLGTDEPFVTAAVDGEDATITLDPVAATARVDLGTERDAGEAVLLRLSLRYSLADASTLGGDGPVGYGLLARDDNVSVLSHWLPLLTFDTSPIVDTGDLGAFPAAIWSAEIVHDGVLVTGGVEGPCRIATDNCTRAQGAGLRDLSMLIMDEGATLSASILGHEVRVVHPSTVSAADARIVLDETVAAVEMFSLLFGGLAWPQTDVVGTPLSRGAAGMEYPGMFILRDDLWRSHDGAFGTYVIAHEVAHQWFHALVGNSSLTDPVIDEAIAQYLSWIYFADLLSTAAADELADDMFDRWENGRAAGYRDDPPAQPLADFESDAAYGAIVYGRAPFALIEADLVLGRDVVIRFLHALVNEAGLGTVSVDDVLRVAGEVDEGLQGSLTEWWLGPDPTFDPTP